MGKQILCLLVFLFAGVRSHMSIFVPSMWGSEPSNPNSNWAVQPLQELDFVDWWMHGPRSLNDSPPAKAVTELPAGGIVDFQITGNKAFTDMGRGLWCKPGATPRWIPDPWSNDMGGGSSNIHAQTHDIVAGCALGIAYKSKVTDVKPADFVIFSVVHDCIARQLQTFDVPALPACPNGMCICSWFWIHNSTGGTDQMYMTPFQCNVTNPSQRVIGTPVPPVRCDGQPPCFVDPSWGNRTTVCPKVLQPMYWKQNDGNNIFNPGHCSPMYNSAYGFPDGAQSQIFVDSLKPPTGTVGDTLYSTGENALTSSPATILVSPLYKTKLEVQNDGNVVLYDVESGKSYWASNTNGKGVAPYKLVIQDDGNLVLSDSKGTSLWASNTSNKSGAFPPYRLKMRDTATLSIVDSNSTPLWAVNQTGVHMLL